MTEKSALHTQGTKFSRGTGSPLAYTVIAQITAAAPPGKKRKALDVTTLDQTSASMEYVGAVLTENEPVDLEIIYAPDDSGQSSLETDMAAAAPVPYRVTLANGTTYSFMGLVTAWKFDGKLNDLYKAKVTVQPSGDVTKASGS